MNVRKYRSEWLRLKDRYERVGARIMRKALREAAMNIPFDNLDPYHYRLSVDFNVKQDSIEKAYVKLYTDIGVSHGKRVGRAVNKELRKKEFDPVGFAERYPEEVIQFIRNELGFNIRTVRAGLVDYLMKFIADKFAEGASVNDISRDIQRHILSRGFYRWQIERIVRTETTSAANRGAFEAGKDTGIVQEKVWISASDSRTRMIERGDQFDHRDMQGVRVDYDDPFIVPGIAKVGNAEVMYPGDPNVPRHHAGAIINCRCSMAVVPKRDEDGSFIFT